MTIQDTEHKVQTEHRTQNTEHEQICALVPVLCASQKDRGVTLLLVILVLSALLPVSLGIFNIIYGQIRISGETGDSFIALYAADQGIEKMLYRDRVLTNLCPAEGSGCYTEGPTSVQSNGCYTARVDKISGVTTLTVSGQYRCGADPTRTVKRGFSVIY